MVRSALSRSERAKEREGAAAIDDSDFLGEVRAFLREALTPELRSAGRFTIGTYSDIAAARLWHRNLYEKGWIAPAWPKAWGGTGWTVRQRLLFERECAAQDAPVLFASGLRTIGPLLIEMGTQEQRLRHLPRILSGEDLWCQGFSETMAGSDLAALQTRADAEGDHYTVNGAKLWTTGAHHANWMFCLARTAPSESRQRGITFLLLDMSSPGVHIRPIITLAGDHEVNEVRLGDVRVPMEQRVGPENEGWKVAKVLMLLARGSNTTSALLRRAWRQALRRVENGARPLARAAIEIELQAFEALEERMLATGRAVTEEGASLLKVRATELHQGITELGLDSCGLEAMALDRNEPEASFTVRKYLNTRAASIYSGTSETQRNVLARSWIGRL